MDVILEESHVIKQIAVKDVFETYAYFYIDEATNHGFLIDPGAEANRLLEIIKKEKYVIEKILLTHGHFDHMGAVQQIQDYLHIPVYMHEEGKHYATNTIWNLSGVCGRNVQLENIHYFKDDTIIDLQANPSFKVQALHVPGHTLDSVVYYNECDQVAFVGDTIFAGTIGRSDFFGGNKEQLISSIQQKIFTLPELTILYSGHSIPTTVGKEKLIHGGYNDKV